MHLRSSPPSSRPQPESQGTKQPTFREFLSRRPGASPLISLLPFVASLRPGSHEDVRLSTEVSRSPVINFLPDSESSSGEPAIDAPRVGASALGQAPHSIPIPSESSSRRQRWRRSAARLAVLPAAALAVVGAAFLAGRSDWLQRSPVPTRSVATPVLK